MGFKDLLFYYAVLIRRLPIFLVIVVTVTVLGAVVVYMLPPMYRASAKILVEGPKISADLAPSTVPSNPIAQLAIYQQEVTTRENLLDMANRLGVYAKSKKKMSESDIVDDMFKRTSFDLVSDGRDGSGAVVFSVSYDDRNPELAARVVNAFVDLILQKNVSSRTGRAKDTLQFFAGEVTRLGNDLKTMDQKILSFTNDHHDALPDSLDFRRLQQSSLQERLQMLDWEEAGLRTRRNNLVQMFEATGDVGKGIALTPDQETLQALKRTLSDQLVIFSDSSPNIVAIRARIASLEKQIHASGADRPDAQDKADVRRPPSQLDFQLSDIDERLKFISRERASIDKTLADLARTIAATPDNAMILNALQRSRATIQDQYSAAVKRYSEASTGKEIEVAAKGERFSLVEPAVAPRVPAWPNRKRLFAMALAAGLGLGAGYVVLMELLNKSVRRPAELVNALQIQPIATIPLVVPIRRRRSVGRLSYAAGLVAVAALGQLLWISSAGSP